MQDGPKAGDGRQVRRSAAPPPLLVFGWGRRAAPEVFDPAAPKYERCRDIDSDRARLVACCCDVTPQATPAYADRAVLNSQFAHRRAQMSEESAYVYAWTACVSRRRGCEARKGEKRARGRRQRGCKRAVGA